MSNDEFQKRHAQIRNLLLGMSEGQLAVIAKAVLLDAVAGP